MVHWRNSAPRVARGSVQVGDVVEVRSSEGDGVCGLELPDGVETGFLPDEGQSGAAGTKPFLQVGLCNGRVTPGEIRAFRAEMPPPTGSGVRLAQHVPEVGVAGCNQINSPHCA
jgi:hypothetical protein